ncbi:MAG: YecA family protein [Desulfitobacteriaceae bacterium]
MDDQVLQLSSQVARNDLCPCGSGKKYKKCCLPKDKEKERLRWELESINDITDQYFSVKEYIEETGHPVIMFDYLLIEILNIIGGILHAYNMLNTAETKEILSAILKEAKRYYSACLQCEYACLSEPLKTISFESLIDKGLRIEEFPKNLQKPVSVNFFYFEFLFVISQNLFEEIRKIIPVSEAEQITGTVNHALFDFVSDNCWDSCDNKCLKEHSKNAYCNFCMFGEDNLPCPKKGEITYTEINVNEEDMIH